MLAWLSVWGKMQICICSADATATHCVLLQQIQIGFIFLVPAHPGSPRHSQGGHKTVVVVVVVVVVMEFLLYAYVTTTTIFTVISLGLPGRVGTRRNIHPLTPIILIINYPASSIYYDP